MSDASVRAETQRVVWEVYRDIRHSSLIDIHQYHDRINHCYINCAVDANMIIENIGTKMDPIVSENTYLDTGH